MKGKIIHGLGDTVGLVTNSFRVHEVPNNIRKIFSDYIDSKYVTIDGQRMLSYAKKPKEFKDYSYMVEDLLIQLVSPGSTSNRKKNTLIYEVLVGNQKKYYTKKETEEIIEL